LCTQAAAGAAFARSAAIDLPCAASVGIQLRARRSADKWVNADWLNGDHGNMFSA
jgi:hypothetical protein